MYMAALFGGVGFCYGPGAKRYLLQGALYVAVPALVGYGVGITMFGNPAERRMLTFNRNQYEGEFDSYKRELFYN